MPALRLERRLLGEGKAPRTVSEYVKWVNRFARWCVLNGHDVESAEAHVIRAWVDDAIPPGRESRKQAHTALRHLYTMLGRSDEPWRAIRVPAKRKGNPRPLSEPERVRMRDTAVMVGGRKGLVTIGMLQTCCRPSEVASWRWDGIDWPRQRIRFWRPKVRDWHTLPLRPALAEALERYMGPDPEGFVFPGNNGHAHICATTVWEWVKDVARIAEVADVNPRRLRATAVTRVLEATDSIDIAAQWAGHADPAVTRTYYAATSWARLAGGGTALD